MENTTGVIGKSPHLGEFGFNGAPHILDVYLLTALLGDKEN